MTITFRKPALVAGIIMSAALAAPASAETFVTIGTGGQTGVYYVVGQSICRLVNFTCSCNRKSIRSAIGKL